MRLNLGPKKYSTYIKATSPSETKASVANAHVVLMLLNMMSPMCAKAAASTNDGIKNAATADAATFGYESMGCLD